MRKFGVSWNHVSTLLLLASVCLGDTPSLSVAEYTLVFFDAVAGSGSFLSAMPLKASMRCASLIGLVTVCFGDEL